MHKSPLPYALLLSLLFTPALSWAASLAGQVRASGAAPVPPGAALQIDCRRPTEIEADRGRAVELPTVPLGDYGEYRHEGLPGGRWCRLTLVYEGGRSTTVRLFLDEHHNSANLLLLPWKQGWLLRKQ